MFTKNIFSIFLTLIFSVHSINSMEAPTKRRKTEETIASELNQNDLTAIEIELKKHFDFLETNKSKFSSTEIFLESLAKYQSLLNEMLCIQHQDLNFIISTFNIFFMGVFESNKDVLLPMINKLLAAIIKVFYENVENPFYKVISLEEQQSIIYIIAKAFVGNKYNNEFTNNLLKLLAKNNLLPTLDHLIIPNAQITFLMILASFNIDAKLFRNIINKSKRNEDSWNLIFEMRNKLGETAFNMAERRNFKENAKIMVEPYNKQPESLNFYCAKYILANKMSLGDMQLPEQLQDYLKYVNKEEELNQHILLPIFKKYLKSCLNNISLEELQEILCIIDKARKLNPRMCTTLQRSLPNLYNFIFYNNHLYYILYFINLFCSPKSFHTNFNELINNKTISIGSAADSIKENLNESNRPIYNKLIYNWLTLKHLKEPITSQNYNQRIQPYINLAKAGHIDALTTFVIFRANFDNNLSSFLITIEKFIRMDEFSYAVSLVDSILYQVKNLFSDPKDYLEQDKFCKLLDIIISHITNEQHYNPLYSLTLVQIYSYLKDDINVKKYAEKYLEDNKGILHIPILTALKNIYKKEHNSDKEQFYNNKIQEEIKQINLLKNN